MNKDAGGRRAATLSAAGTEVDLLAVRAAAERLAAGGLVAFPTETVYGLGARADDDAAVAAVFAAKGRPADHPLIVHLARAEAATEFAASLSSDAQRLMAAFWPGPLTLIVPRRAGRGAAAAGGQSSIGLRMPSHPTARALLRACADLGVAGIAAPSANLFGRVSPTTADHVRQELGPALLVLDGGPCEVGIESTIVDCTRAHPAVLRPGQISSAQLQAVLGRALALPDAASPRASGTLASHYAPSAPVRLLATADLLQAVQQRGHQPDGKIVAVYSRVKNFDPFLSAPASVPASVPVPASASATAAATTTASVLATAPAPGWLFKTMPDDADAAAHGLFADLRALDAAGVAAIWVEAPPEGSTWDGVRDRLTRAAA